MRAPLPVALVEAARLGDQSALAELLALAQPAVRGYARRACRRTADVEDAMQEALIVLYRRIGGLRSAVAFSGWLMVIVDRICLRFARRMLLPVPASRADRVAELERMPAAQLRLELAAAVQSLPETYRAVILCRDLEEMTVDEIGARLGLSREAVKGRLHRGRALMREYLAP